MKNAKQLLAIASIAAGISISNKTVHAQQASINKVENQSIYNYSIYSNKVVNLGDKGPIIKNIQSALNSYFGKDLIEDGVFGLQTRKAVIQVQKKLGLAEDGIFGPETAKALLKYSCNFSVDDKNGFSPVPINIQKKLIYLGYNVKLTENLTSSDTVSAITNFQKKNHLDITGKIDIKSLNKLNEKVQQLVIETEHLDSNTDYYVLVNSSNNTCKIYRKTNNFWKETKYFDIFSGSIAKGVYNLGIHGNNLDFNGIPMKDFTQIDGLNVFYSAPSDSGYGLRVSNESAKFLNTLPPKTTIKII